jgi:S-adenosylmethionine-diacylgycerolhomoserine-N-methlytransferase
MRLLERCRDDARILRAMARGMPGGGSLRQQLDAFYAPQARHYDRFRERLLHGREALVADIDLPPAATIVDLGGGTGRMIEFFAARIDRIARYTVVDLCAPLLDQARQRSRSRPQMTVVHADAAHWQPERAVDVVVLSYALSMMPTWRDVIERARGMLRSGGILAAVDFHVSTAATLPPRVRHGWLTRRFWPAWFAHDGVRLDPQRLDALCETFPDHALVEARGAVPYLPLLTVPYYRFLGRAP